MTEVQFVTLMQKMGAFDSPDDTKRALETVIKSLTEVLIQGGEIMLEGLGAFSVVEDKFPIRGPTRIPGYPYPKKEILTKQQLLEDIRKQYYLEKNVKVIFDKALEQKINKVSL